MVLCHRAAKHRMVLPSRKAHHRPNRKEVPIHRQVEHLRGSGAPQGKDDKGKGGFSSTGETQTFTVSDDTTVKIVTMKDGSADSSDGSVSDLTKGTMIRIQYTDSSKKNDQRS